MKNKFLISTAIMFTISSFNVLASGSWSCGDTCTATLDDHGTLTISGTGEMTNYADKTDVPWYEDRSSITSIVFKGTDTNSSAGITKIGNNVFNGTAVSAVTLPSTLTEIGESAFQNTSSLQSITFPESLTTIRDRAFKETGITDIYIPKNVTTLGGDIFRGSALKSVEFAEDSQIQSTGTSRSFLLATNLEKVVLPDGLKTIATDTFYGDGKLTSINIPDSVTTIHPAAFEAVQLTELTTNADNLIRFLHPNKTTCSYYCGGNFKEGVDIKINCTGTVSCENAVQDWLKENYGDNEENWPSWSNRIAFNNKVKVKNADGSYSVYDLGRLVGFEGKRIYTVEEATLISKPKGNIFKLRYR